MNRTKVSTHGFLSLLFVSIGVAAASAACGGGGAAGPGPGVPGTSGTGTPTAGGTTGSATGSTAGTTGGPATGATGATPPPVFSGPMLAPKASMMAGDLTAAGLDPKKLPALDKLDPKVLRAKVMPLFSKSLGIKCGDCHVEGDFAAPTRRKNIANKMWDEFVVKLSMDDGSPLFCDSCHQGRVLQLDRHDKKALAKWMQANFVNPLKRRDGKDHECATCHGEEMDYELLKKWSGGLTK